MFLLHLPIDIYNLIFIYNWQQYGAVQNYTISNSHVLQI